MSTLQVNAIQNTSGVEQYLAKAWVNFNGTGTVAIRASGNVSSITDHGTGDYTVNFTNFMVDANYSTLVTGNNGNLAVTFQGVRDASAVPTSSAVRLYTANSGGASLDIAYVNVAIFR